MLDGRHASALAVTDAGAKLPVGDAVEARREPGFARQVHAPENDAGVMRGRAQNGAHPFARMDADAIAADLVLQGLL